MKMRNFWPISPFFFLGPLIIALSCGGKPESVAPPSPPAEPLSAILLSAVPGDSLSASLSQASDAYQKAGFNIILNATNTVLNLNASPEEYQTAIHGSDLVVFPSWFNRPSRSASAFLPVSASDTPPIPGSNTIYQATETPQSWAIPLGVDPIILILKKEALQITGNNTPLSNWVQLEQLGTTAFKKMNAPFPQMVFTSIDPRTLPDALFAYRLAYGFQYARFAHDSDILSHMSDLEKLKIDEGSMAAIRKYIQINAEDPLVHFPMVQDMNEFVNGQALMTIAPYSEYNQLPAESKSKLAISPLPHTPLTPTSIVPCVAYALAIPKTAQHPERAEAFIHFLQTHPESLANAPFIPISAISNGNALLPSSSQFLVRETAEFLDEAALLRLVNEPREFGKPDDSWKVGFYLGQ